MKEHLHRRLPVAELLSQEADSDRHLTIDDANDWQNVLLKHDRIYAHKIMRVHYTTYDVRRGEDIVHVGTSQCNIMVLNPLFSAENLNFQHPFWYARVIGIFHANIIYIGKGNNIYQPRRMDFLWVRWYHFEKNVPYRWSQLKLDKLCFPPLTHPASFGFLDPDDVLRSAHIIPDLHRGKVHSDGEGISRCARDGADWNFYTINRCVQHIFEFALGELTICSMTSFVDRDMMMRHYWGLGVGHTYARISTVTARSLYLKTHPQCQSETQSQHQSEMRSTAEEPVERRTDEDEESELGDDDMVFIEDEHDWDSDEDGLHDLD